MRTDDLTLGASQGQYCADMIHSDKTPTMDSELQRLETRVERAPVPGATLELTIDQNLQYIAERELKAGIDENNARGGAAIIMDPRTGEILALASYPTFNPNAVGRFTDDERRNRATQDVYEPGSTFKMVTASGRSRAAWSSR